MSECYCVLLTMYTGKSQSSQPLHQWMHCFVEETAEFYHQHQSSFIFLYVGLLVHLIWDLRFDFTGALAQRTKHEAWRLKSIRTRNGRLLSVTLGSDDVCRCYHFLSKWPGWRDFWLSILFDSHAFWESYCQLWYREIVPLCKSWAMATSSSVRII